MLLVTMCYSRWMSNDSIPWRISLTCWSSALRKHTGGLSLCIYPGTCLGPDKYCYWCNQSHKYSPHGEMRMNSIRGLAESRVESGEPRSSRRPQPFHWMLRDSECRIVRGRHTDRASKRRETKGRSSGSLPMHWASKPNVEISR